GADHPVTGAFVKQVVELMGEAYSELVANQAFVEQVMASEEERFGATWRQGTALFDQEVHRAREAGSTGLPGDVAFRLHDTYGFPLEQTLEEAAEQGLTVDTAEFERLMEEQRTRARRVRIGQPGEGDEAMAIRASTALGDVAASAGRTEFLGY